jgi:hypothetical protein
MKVAPVGPDAPPALAELLNDLRNGLLELAEPTYPHAVFATTTALMPPAADWPSCVLKNTTLNVLAVSDGTNWIRQDTGAAI